MKILILANKPPYPPKDGGSIAIFNLALGLANEGNSVHILAYNTNKHFTEVKHLPQIKNLAFTHINLNTSIRPFKLLQNLIFSNKPYIAERFVSNNYINALKELLEQNNFDLVQLEGPYLQFCIPCIRKFSKAKIVLRAHNVEYEIWQRTAAGEKNLLKKWYFENLSKRLKIFETKLTAAYDILLPITSRDGKMFEALGNNKPMFVVPVGIDTDNIKTGSSYVQNAIYYIGALDWVPNQEGLLWFLENVWPQILNTRKNTILHIAGRNAPQWLIPKIALQNVMFHGEVPNAYSFMQNAGIMIVPLLSGSGMRVKIIEGMAMGKAIVSTTIGVEGIDVENGKEILVADKPSDFAQKIVSLLESVELLTSISKNARKCAIEKYDNKNISKKLSTFFLRENTSLSFNYFIGN